MQIDVETIDGITVATIPVPELDASNVGELKRDMAPILEANTLLVIDLIRVISGPQARKIT